MKITSTHCNFISELMRIICFRNIAMSNYIRLAGFDVLLSVRMKILLFLLVRNRNGSVSTYRRKTHSSCPMNIRK